MPRKPKVKFTAADERKLKRQITKQVEKKVAPALEKQARQDLRKLLNGMSGEFAGQPVAAIKPVLQKRYAKATGGGGSITDPDLTAYAEAVSRGESFS